MGRSIEFLNGCKRDVEMRHSLSLNGDVDAEDEADEVGEPQERSDEGVGMGGCGNL